MLAELTRLWRGEIPLALAFWRYAVIIGVGLNLLMSGLALTAAALTGSALLAVAIHFAAIPYNALSCIGAWKSASQYRGPAWHASWAKLATSLLFIGLFIL